MKVVHFYSQSGAQLSWQADADYALVDAWAFNVEGVLSWQKEIDYNTAAAFFVGDRASQLEFIYLPAVANTPGGRPGNLWFPILKGSKVFISPQGGFGYFQIFLAEFQLSEARLGS